MPIKHSHSKKAFELQFHWIFIMVAGIIILLFFFTITKKQQSIMEQKQSINLESSMDVLLTTTSQSPGTTQNISLTSMRAQCTSSCDCTFAIGKKPKGTSFKDLIVFTPSQLSNAGITWTLSWQVPFRATNFIYLSSSLTTYYLITQNTNEQLFTNIIKKIPPRIRIIPSTPAQFLMQTYKNEPAVIAYFNQEPPQTIPAFDNKRDITIISIYPQDGTITFYEKTNTGIQPASQAFIIPNDIPSMLAALFSQDSMIYKCMMQKAYKQLSIVSTIYNDRITSNEYKNKDPERCLGLSTAASTAFQNIIQSANTLSTTTSQPEVQELARSAIELTRVNNDAIQASCPVLY